MSHQKSKIILSSLIFLAISSIAFFNLSPAQAVDFTYKPMEKIPGFEDVNIADFPTLVETIYKFGIWVVGICAFFMITVGGYTYMTSAGNTSTAGTGKKIITDALIGLVLALTAYLIFYVINPNITSVDLQIAPGGGTGATPTAPTTPTTPPSTSVQEAAKKILSNANIVDETGDCSSSTGVISPKTNLKEVSEGKCATACNANCKTGTLCAGCANLSLKLLNEIDRLSETYKPLVIVSLTGGKHKDNSYHYIGTAADLKPTRDKANWDSAVSQLNSAGCKAFCDTDGDEVKCNVATHVHVTC